MSPCVRVDGHGSIVSAPRARLEIEDVRLGRRAGTFAGTVAYRDRHPTLRFRSTTIASVTRRDHEAFIAGAGVANGRPVTFFVAVADGSPDSFSIRLSTGYFASGPLKSGSIHVSARCRGR